MKTFGKIGVIDAFKNRREPESVHTLADAYWHTLVMVGILGAIAIVAFSFWEFSDVDRVISVKPATTTEVDEKMPFEKKDLQAVVGGFAKRKARYELYSTKSPAVVDPSTVTKTKVAR